jgi:predicted amidophosphoribosyltransferase
MDLNGPRLFRKLVYPCLALAFPTPCHGCGHLLGAFQQLGFCLDCWAQVRPMTGEYRFQAATGYSGVARAILLEAKFVGRIALFKPMGKRIAALARASGIRSEIDLVVAVPSHPVTRIRRGFNPAWELARVTARELDLETSRFALRKKLGSPQALKGARRRRRHEIAATAFTGSRRFCDGRRILLIDDVVTTGATMEGCTAAIEAAGGTVRASLAWARTPATADHAVASIGPRPYNDRLTDQTEQHKIKRFPE